MSGVDRIGRGSSNEGGNCRMTGTSASGTGTCQFLLREGLAPRRACPALWATAGWWGRWLVRGSEGEVCDRPRSVWLCAPADARRVEASLRPVGRVLVPWLGTWGLGGQTYSSHTRFSVVSRRLILGLSLGWERVPDKNAGARHGAGKSTVLASAGWHWCGKLLRADIEWD